MSLNPTDHSDVYRDACLKLDETMQNSSKISTQRSSCLAFSLSTSGVTSTSISLILQTEQQAGAEAVTDGGGQYFRGVRTRCPSQRLRLIHDQVTHAVEAEVHLEDEDLLPCDADLEPSLL